MSQSSADTAPPTRRYAFGPYVVDVGGREISNDGRRVGVEPQVFDVLVVLLRENHRVVAKEELLDEVWGTRMVSESALTTRIKALRRALGDDGASQKVIRTAHGRGFRFVAPMRALDSLPDRSVDGRSQQAVDALSLVQTVKFCTTYDQVRLAYAMTGFGPPLVKAANWLTHLEYDFESPVWRHWLREPLGALSPAASATTSAVAVCRTMEGGRGSASTSGFRGSRGGGCDAAGLEPGFPAARDLAGRRCGLSSTRARHPRAGQLPWCSTGAFGVKGAVAPC